ncbi:hypothetical protein [Amycolatopsis endophytica]
MRRAGEIAGDGAEDRHQDGQPERRAGLLHRLQHATGGTGVRRGHAAHDDHVQRRERQSHAQSRQDHRAEEEVRIGSGPVAVGEQAQRQQWLRAAGFDDEEYPNQDGTGDQRGQRQRARPARIGGADEAVDQRGDTDRPGHGTGQVEPGTRVGDGRGEQGERARSGRGRAEALHDPADDQPGRRRVRRAAAGHRRPGASQLSEAAVNPRSA